jgi:hypothetical protein
MPRRFDLSGHSPLPSLRRTSSPLPQLIGLSWAKNGPVGSTYPDPSRPSQRHLETHFNITFAIAAARSSERTGLLT